MHLIEQKQRLPNYGDLSEEYNIGGFNIQRIRSEEAR
jgi:hypothetical protein